MYRSPGHGLTLELSGAVIEIHSQHVWHVPADEPYRPQLPNDVHMSCARVQFHTAELYESMEEENFLPPW